MSWRDLGERGNRSWHRDGRVSMIARGGGVPSFPKGIPVRVKGRFQEKKGHEEGGEKGCMTRAEEDKKKRRENTLICL